MSNRAEIPFSVLRTAMVLFLLAMGMMAETLRVPHGSLTTRSEQLQLSVLQLASSTAKEKVRIQRADQGVSANSNGGDDSGLVLAEQEVWLEKRILLLAAPRAPPATLQGTLYAYRSRAPPFDMI